MGLIEIIEIMKIDFRDMLLKINIFSRVCLYKFFL